MVAVACYSSSSPTSISQCASLHPPTPLPTIPQNFTSIKDLHKIHAQLIKTGLAKNSAAAVAPLLVFCASPRGDINYASSIFSQLQNPNLFLWNTIIRGFAQSSTPQKTISLFIDMLFSPIQPHHLTYPSVFKVFSQLGLARIGAQLHGRVLKLGLQNDEFIRNTMLFMYANCGFFSEAQRIFDGIVEFDVVSWNTMIMGLAKCGRIDESRRLFDEMESRNTISWNSMISGYVRKNRLNDALELFEKMQEERIKPTEFTMVSLLNACACLGAIRQGEWIHEYIVKHNFELNPIVVTAIINMYSKCGTIDKALQVFNIAPKKALSCWNSMILGLATNGRENEAIQLFSMLKSSDFKPDDVSFLGVLTACNHGGLVDEAKTYFLLMTETYNIKRSVKHYGCMVDVLGRAGLLEQAEAVVRNMSVEPDGIIWGSLLSSCRKYGNIEMAEQALKHLIECDPSESSSFVLMANVYAASSQFDEAVVQRLSLKEKQMEKQPGCSLIEVNGEVHEFISGGRLHPKSRELYSVLDILQSTLKQTRH